MFKTIFLLIIASSCFASIRDLRREDCIQSINGRKIYIKSELVMITKEGSYLHLKSGEMMALPALLTDSQGIYIVPASWADHAHVYRKCPACGEEYIFSCRNPNCSRNKK